MAALGGQEVDTGFPKTYARRSMHMTSTTNVTYSHVYLSRSWSFRVFN